eukprot:TRINITY_DN14367_c0_g1_i1.p1 TRINITY_DN14367_c0_g1~~TRINITY_DN14367_c0_g1_i1.p1  ORF type:complete len:479 (+),score=151.48 TRINITY_DN14367_c0_g1_i1:190-1626(+)
MEERSKIGIVGLGQIGQNLALQFASKGVRVSVTSIHDLSEIDRTMAIAKNDGLNEIVGHRLLQDFVWGLESPRKVLIMVKNDDAVVDSTINSVLEYMEPGDYIIDGSNSHYSKTRERNTHLDSRGIRFIGLGISGGVSGARNGCSLMLGNGLDVDKGVVDLLKVVCAEAEGDHCCGLFGGIGAGHFVKMVHNGLEYGFQEIIAEAYNVLKVIGDMSNDDLFRAFYAYNSGELQGHLMEISAKILRCHDEDGDGFLIDRVLDQATMKGTEGIWFGEESLRRGVACPTILSAIHERMTSADNEGRQILSRSLIGPESFPSVDREQLVDDVGSSIVFSSIMCFAQGLALLAKAAVDEHWSIDLQECTAAWKGGSVIRMKLLDMVHEALDRDNSLANILHDEELANNISARQMPLRRVVTLGMACGVQVPALASALQYFDSYRTSRSPVALVQAQRDCIGAHGFKRNDKQGEFSSSWEDSEM